MKRNIHLITISLLLFSLANALIKKITIKKIIYTAFVLIYFFGSDKLYSQSERQCFFIEKNAEGTVEKIFVTLTRDGKKVDADIKKEMAKGVNTYSLSWEMEGNIEGDKITFIVPQGTRDTFAKDSNPIQGPKATENWVLKGNQLIISNETILKVNECK